MANVNKMPVFRRVIIILIYIGLGAVYLGSIPRIFTDETWDSSLGYNVANGEGLKHPFIINFGGMDVHFVQNRVVLPLVCATVYKFIGYSFVGSRACSLFFGVLGLVGLYSVMRRWYGEKQAFWATFATIIHPWFFEVSRRVRPEIYYIALSMLFLYAVVRYFDSGLRKTAFGVGVIAGLTSLTHPNGLIIIFSIGITLIFWLRGKPIGRLILWASIGFVLTIMPYVIYVLWAVQDPQVSFIEQMRFSELHDSILSCEIGRWKGFLQWPKGLPLAIIMLISWFFAWYRSPRTDKIIATIIASFLLFLPLMTLNPEPRYLAVIVPFFCALAVRLIWRIASDNNLVWNDFHKSRLGIGIGIALVYSFMCIAAIGLMFHRLRGADFNRVVDHIASVVGPGKRVFGSPVLWIGHDRYRYGPYPMDYAGELTVKEGVEMLRKYHIDYVVRVFWVNDSFLKGVGKPPQLMPPMRKYLLQDILCAMYGTKVEEFYDAYYGPFEIYMLNWNRLNPLWLLKTASTE